MKPSSSGAFGKLAEIMVAVPGASKAVAEALLVGIQALTGAGLFVVSFAMSLLNHKNQSLIELYQDVDPIS